MTAAARHERPAELLQELIRFDTTNPPGNEAACVAFVQEVLEAAGCETELYALDPARPNLVSRLRGRGDAPPLLLYGHVDVVTTVGQQWTVPPFEGRVEDGFVWGRGALDMKGLGVAQLMTFVTVKRLGIPLARDLVFFAMADEEAGGQFGVEWLEQHQPESLDAEYVINEGGGGVTELFGVERPVYTVAVAEKGPLWVRLVAEGRPGHASVPHDDNALDRLVRALHRIQGWQRDLTVSPLLAEYFDRLKRAGVFQGDVSADGLRNAAASDPRINALLTNTISATTATAGIKHNVIPARAEATLDCRLLPGVRPDEFQRDLEAVIDDPKVTVERVFAGWSDANPFDTDLFGVIEDVVREHVEDAVVAPGVTVGFTDSRVFRNRGVIAYGFAGSLNHPDLAKSVHGHNERVGIDSLKLNCQMVYEVTRRMCQRGNR